MLYWERGGGFTDSHVHVYSSPRNYAIHDKPHRKHHLGMAGNTPHSCKMIKTPVIYRKQKGHDNPVNGYLKLLTQSKARARLDLQSWWCSRLVRRAPGKGYRPLLDPSRPIASSPGWHKHSYLDLVCLHTVDRKCNHRWYAMITSLHHAPQRSTARASPLIISWSCACALCRSCQADPSIGHTHFPHVAGLHKKPLWSSATTLLPSMRATLLGPQPCSWISGVHSWRLTRVDQATCDKILG